jgi:hypothetical protein
MPMEVPVDVKRVECSVKDTDAGPEAQMAFSLGHQGEEIGDIGAVEGEVSLRGQAGLGIEAVGAGAVRHERKAEQPYESIFSDGFLALVHDHTKGVARKINNLCRTALLLGAAEHKPILDETDLKRVIRDLEGQIG